MVRNTVSRFVQDPENSTAYAANRSLKADGRRLISSDAHISRCNRYCTLPRGLRGRRYLVQCLG